ncbi:MAG: DUF3078 domain-containing protein [candidate division Zixibacteria bacterium]|nr:DUF3078 domain-containing protein [candidate division Zixibacteria bacterium]
MKSSRIIINLILAMMLTTTFTWSQDQVETGWQNSLIIDFTTTQTSYSDSWTGGEAGSVNWAANLNGTAQRQFSPKFDFKSSLKLSFGQTLTQNIDAEGKPWKKPQKSTDLIDWENVGRFTLGWFVDPYVAFRIESQFFDGSVENHKRWLSPLKLTESVGLAHMFYKKDKDFITSRLGLAVREIFTKQFIDLVDYETETISTTDGGLESVTDAELTFGDNLKYTGKLTLYKAVTYSKKDEVKGLPEEDDWKAVDVSLENIVSASITKIITVNLYTQFLWDKQVEKKGRWKETLAIGFVFRML